MHSNCEPPDDRLLNYKRKIIFKPAIWNKKKKEQDEYSELLAEIKMKMDETEAEKPFIDPSNAPPVVVKKKKKRKSKKKKKKKKVPKPPLSVP